MKTQTEILEELGLLYEKNQSPTIESSVEPNGGVLNLDKALADNPECWDTIAIGASQLEKKTIILQCNLNESSKNFQLKQRVISKLIEDNFSVYLPTQEGFKKIEDEAQVALIDKLYHKLDPTEETAQLKKLNLVGDRITFLDGPGFDDLCAKILDSPTAFFHFINFITLDFVHLYSELGYSEMCKSDLNSALEWSFDTAPNPDIDWRKKYVHFEEKISNRKPGEPIPTFLQSAQALHTAEGRDNLYRSYLLQNYPDLLKKPTHISLANNRLPLFSFLNRRENLFSLSIDCCEFGPDEAEEDPDDEVLLTTTLRFFFAQEVRFSAQYLATLLNNSPHLVSLCLLNGSVKHHTPLALNPKKLTHLKTISLVNEWMAISQISDLINATSNLTELNLSKCYGPWDSPLTINAPLTHLKELCVNASLIFDDLYTLVNSAPSLELLIISGFDWMEYEAPLIQLDNPLKALKKMVITRGLMTAGQLENLLDCAPNLTHLEMSDCFIEMDSINVAPNSLPHLKAFIALQSNLNTKQLLNLLLAAPHLHEIKINNPDNLLDLLNRLNPGSLPFLTHITFTSEALSFAELNQLIKVAPNLKSISFPNPKNKMERLASQWLKDSYPQIEIKFLEDSSNSSQELVVPSDGSLSLDGNIGKNDHIPTLPARTIFRAKEGPDPLVSDYHLESFFWLAPSKSFRPYIPAEEHLVPVSESLKCTIQQLEEQFDHPDTAKNSVYGQFIFENPQVGRWLQLPALSAYDTLISYAAEHPDYEIKRCKLSGYYFIKFNKKVESCLVNYILEPENNIDFTLDQQAPKEHLQWISQLSFDATGKLVDCEAYRSLLQLDVRQRIQALAEYCRFEKESAESDIKGNVIDVLNTLIQQRAGVCRHRAQLFSALADALNINASLVDNDVHQFAKVHYKNAHFTLNLGGGAANIINLPMTPVKKRHEAKTNEEAVEKSKQPVPPLKASNRFQTWNNFPIQAQNADELAQKLTANDSYARQWLIFKNNQGIEALHQASLLCKNTLFSRDLDSLVLHNTRVEHNKDQQVDSPISQFLKNATLNPHESFTWFINWSDPKARHVSLNSIIDNEDRNLGGLPIPPNVHLVVGMDERSAYKMGDDFYSRFDAISQAPELPAIVLPDIKLNQPISDDDVLFASPLHWESIFLGRHTFNEGTLEIAPGALMKASQNQTSKLVLHHAPFEDPKFRFLIQELLAKKRFFFNGEWHELHKDFHLVFAQPDLSTYPEVITPKETPKRKRIVNQTTLPLFSNQYKITNQHTLKPLPGFFAADSAFELIVTDNLTEIQWYSLLREAQTASCALTIKATPKVFIPEPLKKWVIPIEPLGQKNRLIISNDLDDAQEKYKPEGAITINVDPKTNFNSLFFHVSLKDKQFKGEDTELLKAIKGGKPVILKGQFATTFAQQVQTLFVDPPTLWVNGEAVSAPNITLITDHAAPFKAVHKTTHEYKPEEDFARLTPGLAEQLKKTYQKLQLTACHSHFIDLPKDPAQHSKWLNHLIQRLEHRAGILPDHTEPTTPEMVMNYLDDHSLVFLTSKTGAGKSYFVQKILPQFGKQHLKPIKIYHGLAGVKNWLEHQDARQPILFLDEANISQNHYALFEALARGEQEFWYEGTCYPLKKHKIIFAGNPTHYEGRFEPDLFRRFPHYMSFEGQRLDNILSPLLEDYDDAKSLLHLIQTYYIKAQAAGLNITSRNAQMMCLRFFILKELPHTQLLSHDFLMRYAILSEIKTLNLDKKLSQSIRLDIKQEKSWKQKKSTLKEVLEQLQPQTKDKKFIWTESRKKIALSIEMLLLIREKKIKGLWDQELGINGIILEAEPGLGKSQLVYALLKAKGVEYNTIAPTNPKEVQAKLLDAFHQGQVVFIEEFNTQVHEELLNALLSGYDLEGNPPKKPGFCLIGTQNPTTFHGRQPLSKALDNRLMLAELSHYDFNEFIQILTEKFQLLVEKAKTLTEEYFSARTYAQSQSLFPPPNPRNVMKVAEEEQRHEVLVH